MFKPGIRSVKENRKGEQGRNNSITMQIDSGADRTICNDKEIIQNYVPHDKSKHMLGITGGELEIFGEGNIGSLFDKVCYAPLADLSVIAVIDLQNKGLTTVFQGGPGAADALSMMKMDDKYSRQTVGIILT
jgi:hypothetical protein